jgi:Cu-Zn family superoxide dismutase
VSAITKSKLAVAVTAIAWTTAQAGDIRLALHGAMASSAPTAGIAVTLRRLTPEGPGKEIGTVRFLDHEHGLLIVPDLHSLRAGPHGAHVHENPDCTPETKNGMTMMGGSAGGHFDPENTGRHGGPYGDGHLGDLPVLFAEADGTAAIPVLAPRLEAADIRGRALVIHAGADRYEDHGADAHGKGGMRMYCGVIL